MMQDFTAADLAVKNLGACRIDSPLLAAARSAAADLP